MHQIIVISDIGTFGYIPALVCTSENFLLFWHLGCNFLQANYEYLQILYMYPTATQWDVNLSWQKYLTSTLESYLWRISGDDRPDEEAAVHPASLIGPHQTP